MRSEQGSAAIAAVGVVVLGFMLMVGVAGIGQVVLARYKVVAAAEAGALAAAPVTFRPFGATGPPSAEADRLVRANGAVLVRCSCRSDPGYSPRTAIVTARLRVAVLGFRELELEATAAAEFSPVELLVRPGADLEGGHRMPE